MLLKDYKNSREHTNVLVLSKHGQIKGRFHDNPSNIFPKFVSKG